MNFKTCFLTIFVFQLASPYWGGDPPAWKILRTPTGERFALFGVKKAAPAPTLFVFASGLEELEPRPYYTEIGRRLAKSGFLYVALDPPCHGLDVKKGEPTQIRGWRHRLEKGEPLIADFTTRVTAVLDHLIKEKYTDPAKVAACGVSRGGFLAVHAAAADKRVKAAIGFAPVTNLLALTEFKGMENHELTKALSLVQLAPKLSGTAVWISIGNNDKRVSTDDAIAFTRQLIAVHKSQSKVIPVELHVGASLGHTDLEGSHERAAAWLLRQLQVAITWLALAVILKLGTVLISLAYYKKGREFLQHRGESEPRLTPASN